MTILLTYTDTSEGLAALEQGRAIAERLGLDVVVFDVDRTSAAADRHLVPPPTDVPAGERWLGPAQHAPSPVEDLLDTAHELDVAAIVVGVRRRTPVGKLIMGSQAQRIILGAPMPVLAVKAKVSGE